MKIDENNYDVFKRVSEVTRTDYRIKWFDAENIDGYIEEDNILSMIEDLIYEIDHLKEEIDDMERDIEDNYRPIPYAEQVGISDRDFI